MFFNGLGAVAATGGSGDNTFIFTTGDGDVGTFSGSGSTVDGGVGGTNTLVIWADTGTILAAGDDRWHHEHRNGGARHGGGAFGALTADLSGLNPTTVFDLNGTYDAAAVTVSNIANDQTVEFSGTSDVGVAGAFVTLAAPTPLGLDAQINLQISDDAFLGRLIVAPGLASLNVHGLEGGGTIDDVTLVLDNINIDGDSFVSIGAFGSFSFLDPTRPTGGTIDAHTDTGGVEVWMHAGPTATGLPAQTFIGGPGGGTVHLQGFGGTNVDFSIAGPDTIQFDSEANYTSTHPILDATHQYNQVLGFTTANDTVNVTNSPTLGEFGAVNFTNGTGVVPAGAATDTFHYTTDTALADAAIDPFNYIKIDPPIAATTGSTVQAGVCRSDGSSWVDRCEW